MLDKGIGGGCGGSGFDRPLKTRISLNNAERALEGLELGKIKRKVEGTLGKQEALQKIVS